MGQAEPPEAALGPEALLAPPGTLRANVSPRRAAIDVGAQIVGRAGNLVLGVVATAVLARGLGQARYGQWTTILLVPSLLGYLNDLGFTQVAVQRAATEDDPRWLGAMITARAALTVPTVLLNVVVVLLLAHGRGMAVAGVIVAAQALLTAPGAMVSVFQLRVRNDLSMAALTANSVLWTVAVIALVHRHSSLTTYAVAMTAIATLTIGLQVVLASRSVRVPLAGTVRLWRELARTAVPLSIGSLLIVAYGKIDGVIVYAQTGSRNAGLYGAAYRIYEQAGFVPLSLTVTLLPLASRAWPASPERARELLRLSLDVLAMVALPALAFSLVASRAAIELLYGPAFAPAASVLPILMGAFVLVCAGYAIGVYTLVLGLQRRFVLYAAAGLVVNVVANLALVPAYGYVAAAWVTLATEAVVLGLIGRAVLARLELRPRPGRLLRATGAAAVAGLAAWLLQRAGTGVVLAFAATVLVDIAALAALRAVRPAEIRALLGRD